MEYVSPNDKLDFLHDVTDWLSTGDTVSSATWTIGSGLTQVSQSDTATGSTMLVIADSDSAGKVLKIDVQITTADGRISSRTWFITVQHQTI